MIKGKDSRVTLSGFESLMQLFQAVRPWPSDFQLPCASVSSSVKWDKHNNTFLIGYELIFVKHFGT